MKVSVSIPKSCFFTSLSKATKAFYAKQVLLHYHYIVAEHVSQSRLRHCPTITYGPFVYMVGLGLALFLLLATFVGIYCSMSGAYLHSLISVLLVTVRHGNRFSKKKTLFRL